MLALSQATSPRWIDCCLGQMGRVLIDHAHCEKKAAASAMSLVNDYPEDSELVRQMAALALEELRHFRQVHRLIVARGEALGRDLGDPYVKALRLHIRPQRDERLLDRLLVSALIEARSCERLGLLGEHLTDPELAHFYTTLAAREGGHATLFVRLAELRCGAPTTQLRLNALRAHESAIVASLA
ncbi:MAG: tRNA-(ms[2]io[6]A)-hydroxylase, partial [Deltaproteobacteria bacterium]